jgi:hypothetical protein
MYIDGQWMSENESRRILKEAGLSGWSSKTGRVFEAVKRIETKLPPGVYTMMRTDHGDFFKPQAFPTDDVIRLPDLPCDLIIDQVRDFWTKSELYTKHGLIHKRGFLLYGAPGCGKTSIIRLLCNDIINMGGVVFSINDFEVVEDFVSTFRSVQPETPIMSLMEDIEGLFDGDKGPSQTKAALAFLDGQGQASNIVHVATTNVPEKIADRFIKRPGRFDLVVGIHTPTYAARLAYLKHAFKDMDEKIIQEVADKTDGMGISYLREIVASCLLGVPVDETIERSRMNLETPVFKNKGHRGYSIGYATPKMTKEKEKAATA